MTAGPKIANMTSHPATHPAPERAYAGVSAADRTDARRLVFLQTGLELIGTVGYRAMTVRLLCKTAGLNDRYFYQLFEGTEALLCAVYQTQMDTLVHDLMATLAQHKGSLDDRIHTGLTVFFTRMRDTRVARVTLTEILGVSPEVDTVYNANTQRFAALLAALLKAQMPKVKVPSELESPLGLAIAGACSMLAMQWMLEGYRTPLSAVVESCALIFRGTVKELAKKKA
jgi:AcrR family transcriptional regulator